MTGGDTKEKKSGAHGADTLSSWLSGYTTPLLSRGGWFEPRGGLRCTEQPEPPFLGETEREREREGRAQWERNREEQQER